MEESERAYVSNGGLSVTITMTRRIDSIINGSVLGNIKTLRAELSVGVWI